MCIRDSALARARVRASERARARARARVRVCVRACVCVRAPARVCVCACACGTARAFFLPGRTPAPQNSVECNTLGLGAAGLKMPGRKLQQILPPCTQKFQPVPKSTCCATACRKSFPKRSPSVGHGTTDTQGLLRSAGRPKSPWQPNMRVTEQLASSRNASGHPCRSST